MSGCAHEKTKVHRRFNRKGLMVVSWSGPPDPPLPWDAP